MTTTQPMASGTRTVELPPGATVDGGRYEIEGVLGQGGFGITYAAVDTRLHRPVAIKELFPPGCVRLGDRVVPRAVDELAQARFERFRARFVDEAENLARFAHVGIVRIYELVEERGTAYVVMERLSGRTLNRLAVERGGRLPLEEAIGVVEHMAAALTVVHEGGLLHRDLKPDNVVVTDDGRIVLVDFGAARQFLPDASSTMTQVLTPRYAALEQYSAHASFGPATDVYGLAATFYRLVAGEAPAAAVDRLHGAVLVPLDQVDGRVPPALSDAVQRGLALEPNDRPRTATAFVATLRATKAPVAVPAPVAAPGPAGVPGAAAVPGAAGAAVAFRLRARPHVDLRWAEDLWAGVQRTQREVAASFARATSRLSWPAAWSRRAPTPVRAWLPLLAILAALASVAPVHVVAAVALVALPAANARQRTEHRYRWLRWTRGLKWHDPVSKPFVFAGEMGRAVIVTVREIVVPLALTCVSMVAALVALGLADHGRRPMAAVRMIIAAAAVALIVTLVRRLERHPRFSPRFGADIVAGLVVPGPKLSTAGRVVWGVAAALSVWVVVLPPWRIG